MTFLTNHLEIPAVVVAGIYRRRWQIELFFRWIKGHLCIKHFFGSSPNAVKRQNWIAVATCLLVANIHKQLRLPGTLHRTLQLLSVHPVEKLPLHELLRRSGDFMLQVIHIKADRLLIQRLFRSSDSRIQIACLIRAR